MKKKGLVAMGLAGVMTIGMCVPVFAADSFMDAQQDVENGNSVQEKDLKMDVASQYSVTIPAKIKIDSDGKAKGITLKASKTILGNGKSLEITVNNKLVSLQLADDTSTTYDMNFEGSTAVTDSEWALHTFENSISDPKEVQITLSPAEGASIKKSGVYSAKITFNIHEVSVPVS